jgi:hypothetical protein
MSAAPSSISARTGVIPVVPMISAEVISAPSQCETSMIFWPATPGKKYLLPPEMPTTSWGRTGPTTRATSWSTTARLSSIGTSRHTGVPLSIRYGADADGDLQIVLNEQLPADRVVVGELDRKDAVAAGAPHEIARRGAYVRELGTGTGLVTVPQTHLPAEEAEVDFGGVQGLHRRRAGAVVDVRAAAVAPGQGGAGGGPRCALRVPPVGRRVRPFRVWFALAATVDSQHNLIFQGVGVRGIVQSLPSGLLVSGIPQCFRRCSGEG